MSEIALIDYGAGNIPSVTRALEIALKDAGISSDLVITNDPDKVASADRIIIPGVGHFRDCRDGLFRPDGMVEALNTVFADKARPILGICVGMQLMASVGLEDGETEGLNWVPGRVEAIPDKGLPIPHMGWNEIIPRNEHAVLAGINSGDHAYFVHSYHFVPENESDIYISAEYGTQITAGIGRDTAFGVQFHPEISQKTGLKLLKNWISWRP